MIFDVILGLLIGMFTGALSLFPSYTLPASITNFGSAIGSSVGTADSVFPVIELGICIGLVIVARLFIVTWALVSWVYGKIPLKMT